MRGRQADSVRQVASFGTRAYTTARSMPLTHIIWYTCVDDSPIQVANTYHLVQVRGRQADSVCQHASFGTRAWTTRRFSSPTFMVCSGRVGDSPVPVINTHHLVHVRWRRADSCRQHAPFGTRAWTSNRFILSTLIIWYMCVDDNLIHVVNSCHLAHVR